MEQNIGTWQRVGSVAGGGAAVRGARRPRVAAMTRATGVGLVLPAWPATVPSRPRRRAIVGRTARQALSGPRGIHVQETVVIDRPRPGGVLFLAAAVEPAAVHVAPGARRYARERPVALGGRRAAWAIRSSGMPRSSTRSTATCWRGSRCRARTSTAPGSVRIRDLPGGSTELTVHLQYQPPAGRLGAWAAWMAGRRALASDSRRPARGEALPRDGRRAGRPLIHGA